MILATLVQVVADCNVTAAGDTPLSVTRGQISSLTTDTWTASDDKVFAAIKGARADGAELAGVALPAGVRAIVASDPPTAVALGTDPARVIVTGDVEKTIGALTRVSLRRARAEGNPALKAVAMAGSAGKTTVKDLLTSLVESRRLAIALPGSFSNEPDLSVTVLRTDAGITTPVFKMGADYVDNIDYFTSTTPPDVSTVLIVVRACLGEFGSIDSVGRAKFELMTGTYEGGVVILNTDDSRVVAMTGLVYGSALTFSVRGAGDVVARNIDVNTDGRASSTLVTPEDEADVRPRFVGEHHVADTPAATVLAHSLEIPTVQIVSTLSAVGVASPHHMDVFETGGAMVTDDSYNVSPDFMRAGLATLERLGHGWHKVAIFGEMLELGEASLLKHEAIGKAAAQAGVACLVAVDEEARPLAPAAEAGGVDTTQATGPEGALRELNVTLAANSAVLVKGPNGSGVWRVVDSPREERK